MEAEAPKLFLVLSLLAPVCSRTHHRGSTAGAVTSSESSASSIHSQGQTRQLPHDPKCWPAVGILPYNPLNDSRTPNRKSRVKCATHAHRCHTDACSVGDAAGASNLQQDAKQGKSSVKCAYECTKQAGSVALTRQFDAGAASCVIPIILALSQP